jgi:hypothetical protein
MKNLERRIERLENELTAKHGPRSIYIHPNLGEEEEETPYQVQVSSELWAYAMGGGPFTDEEIRQLREEYSEESIEKEPETKKGANQR